MYDSLFLYFPAEFLDLLFDFHFTTHLSLKLNISSKRRILPRFTNSHARTLTTIFEAIESSSFYGHYLSPKLFSPRCNFDPRLVQSMGGKRPPERKMMMEWRQRSKRILLSFSSFTFFQAAFALDANLRDEMKWIFSLKLEGRMTLVLHAL